MPELTRQKKITLGEMRATGVRGLLIYCSDYKCSHWTAIGGDRWPDGVRLGLLSGIIPVLPAMSRRVERPLQSDRGAGYSSGPWIRAIDPAVAASRQIPKAEPDNGGAVGS